MPSHTVLLATLQRVTDALPPKERRRLTRDLVTLATALSSSGPAFWRDPEKARATKVKMRAAARKRWSDPAAKQAQCEARRPTLVLTWRSTKATATVHSWWEAAQLVRMKPETLGVYVSKGKGSYSRTVDDDVVTIRKV